ncbi:MAG: TorF family putative porin, partial [Polaromonas sp.]|nr:TorF family putative porin [Polaromonas sp.]
MKFKATHIAVAAALLAAGSVFAQAAAPAPESTVSYNIGATTDYRYRGISQSGKKPAINGGIDYAHSSGFYLGTWASTITWLKDTTANP